MRLLFDIVRDPDRLPILYDCDHRHRSFTHDYHYECMACGARFDGPWYDEERISEPEETAVSYVDFEELKAENPIDEVAERLGLKLTKRGQSLRGPCPSGEGDERSLAVTPSKQVWFSFAAQKGGDVLELVRFVNDCSLQEAAQFLQGTVPLEKAHGSSPDEGSEARGGFAPLTYLEYDHPSVQALGLEPEDAEALGIGYAKRGTHRGKVAVPIRREDGLIAGYIGVTEAGLPPKWEL